MGVERLKITEGFKSLDGIKLEIKFSVVQRLVISTKFFLITSFLNVDMNCPFPETRLLIPKTISRGY